MSTPLLAMNAFLALLVFAAAGVLFGWLAHVVARRWSSWALVPTWAIGTIAATLTMVARIHQQQTAIGLSAQQQARFPTFWMFLPMWAVGLGFVTFAIRRRSPAANEPFGKSPAIASLKAFALGLVIFLLVFAMLDVTSIISF